MTNQERIAKLQELQLSLIFIKKELDKERNLNSKPEKEVIIKENLVEIAKEVDRTIGISGQVEKKVIEGFKKYTTQKKMGINNQIKIMLEITQDAIIIFNKKY